jgi:hypothetical protein
MEERPPEISEDETTSHDEKGDLSREASHP